MTDLLEPTTHLPIELRAVKGMDVKFPQRTIELVAVPYDEDAAVFHHGKWITESVAPGSFDGIEKRANRIKVNRDHDVLRSIGRALALYPSRLEGLVARIKISNTPDGNDALELAADGVLDASVGFAPFPGHEIYTDNRSRRRITKAFLDHIALTGDPAYDGAQVLAVRSKLDTAAATAFVEHGRVATPNLDRILAERQARAYDAL